MEAKELRIGNLVEYGDGEIIVDIDVFRDFNIYKSSGIKPIPLTEGWLVRFGFVNLSQTTDYYFRKGDFILGGTRKRLFPSIHSESGLEAFGNEIQHVHQLQNLYFALTGQELCYS